MGAQNGGFENAIFNLKTTLKSGKEKAHKHKQIFPVTARVGGGSPDRVGGGGLPTGGQGSKVYVLCAESKEHKHFRPGTRPGGIGFPAGRFGDRGDREIVYVPNVYVPFSAPIKTPRFLNQGLFRRYLAFSWQSFHGKMPENTCSDS